MQLYNAGIKESFCLFFLPAFQPLFSVTHQNIGGGQHPTDTSQAGTVNASMCSNCQGLKWPDPIPETKGKIQKGRDNTQVLKGHAVPAQTKFEARELQTVVLGNIALRRKQTEQVWCHCQLMDEIRSVETRHVNGGVPSSCRSVSSQVQQQNRHEIKRELETAVLHRARSETGIDQGTGAELDSKEAAHVSNGEELIHMAALCLHQSYPQHGMHLQTPLCEQPQDEKNNNLKSLSPDDRSSHANPQSLLKSKLRELLGKVL